MNPTFLPDLPGALCVKTDPELFFSTHRTGQAKAKAICRTCPAKTDCRSYAIDNPMAGVWGGTTSTERHQITGRTQRVPYLRIPGADMAPCGTQQALHRHKNSGQRCTICESARDQREEDQRSARRGPRPA